MKKTICLFLSLACLNSYAWDSFPSDSDSIEKEKIENIDQILNQAEDVSSVVDRKILDTSRIMITTQEVIMGSCWDYIDGVYERAGYSSNHRLTVFKSKLESPYAEESRVEGGDINQFNK